MAFAPLDLHFFKETECRILGEKKPVDWVFHFCEESGFLAAAVTGKKLAEVVEDKHQSFFPCCTSEFPRVGK